MSAGLPTDDPWGDRQQALPLDAFERAAARGAALRVAARDGFDYSNLGYGILGRVITAVAGAEYRDVVRERLLAPLGMTSSGFDEDEIPAERLAHGYARAGEDLVREGEDVLRGAGLDGRRVLDGPRPQPVGPRVPRRVPGPRRPGGRPSAPPVVAPRDAAGPPSSGRGGRGPPRPRGASRRGAVATATGCGRSRDRASGPSSDTVAGTRATGRTCVWHPATGLGVVAPATSATRVSIPSQSSSSWRWWRRMASSRAGRGRCRGSPRPPGR